MADDAAMRAFAADRAFAHLFCATADGPLVAHVPVLVAHDPAQGDALLFHLARANPIAAHLDGAGAVASIAGPDAYLSPDWYVAADQVPTWNYVAVTAHGIVRRLDDDALIAQLDGLSATHEARLAPKPVWTRAKMTPGRFDRMLPAIIGFRLDVARWAGTAKLSQNKGAADRAGAMAGLRAAGRGDMADAMAAGMARA